MSKKNELKELLPGEEFRAVDLNGRYRVSNYGRVISNAYGYNRLLKGQKDAMGYLHYRLFFEGKAKLEKEHRLVAKAFIPVEENSFKEVNHKNGIKTDNRVENLEWVTRGENIRHAHRTGLFSEEAKREGGAKRRKLVKATYPDGNVEYINGVLATAIYFKLSPITVRLIANENKTSRYGIKFEFVDEMPYEEWISKLDSVQEKLDAYYIKYHNKKKPSK